MENVLDYLRNAASGIGDTALGQLQAFFGKDEELGGVAVPVDNRSDLFKKVREPKAMGKDVNALAIDLIADAIPGGSREATKKLLEYTSKRESNYNTNPNTYNKREVEYTDRHGKKRKGTVGHGGSFQVTSGALQAIQQKQTPAMLKAKQALIDKLGIDIDAVPPEDFEDWLSVPINSTAAARLYYWMAPDGLPDTDKDREAYYKRNYRGY